jgi:ParB-like chromosome segregation protein Spo0J
MKLLKISIIEDGWTQPIVVNSDYSIVDGFHRWTVSATPQIHALTDGLVPVVILKEKSQSDKQMATIRHNRARGTHGVLEMSNIVVDLVESGLQGEEIMTRLGMEKEEVVRLLFKNGIPKSKVFNDLEFSKSWTPK